MLVAENWQSWHIWVLHSWLVAGLVPTAFVQKLSSTVCTSRLEFEAWDRWHLTDLDCVPPPQSTEHSDQDPIFHEYV